VKIGVLGLIAGDLTDVTYEKLRWASELGFHGVGAHLTVPAESIDDALAERVRATFAQQSLHFLQLWGPYPCIIARDEEARRRGVAGAREIVRLAARLGVPGAGVRPTSLNPRGEWWPHPDNFLPETEDRLVRSLGEILETAEDCGVEIVLETHQTTTLNSAEAIRRVIERTGSRRVSVNLDPCNFVGDLRTAFNPAPMINELFDVLGQYIATVHVKDYYLEDRFVFHVAETVIGTGIMDFATVLRRAYQTRPGGYVIIEHLPVSLIPLAKRNLSAKIQELGIPIG
jgi:sugar phosphate isomerase/epimerase